MAYCILTTRCPKVLHNNAVKSFATLTRTVSPLRILSAAYRGH